MKNRSGEKIQLTSINELLGVVNEESAMEIELRMIHGFSDHPFKVIDDEKMQDLVDSIATNGILSPVLLRPDKMGCYEMISGHRRMHAARIVGLTTIPAIVRDMSDDEAIIAMVDANIQREELFPSEKAFAYKMKLDALKHRAGRPAQNNLSQIETNYRADQVMADEVGDSRAQIRRYIRLTELIPELLDMVDNKRLGFTVAVDISYIDQNIQQWIYEYIHDTGFIKPIQISELRKQLEYEAVNQSMMIATFNRCLVVKKKPRKVTFTEKKLTKYFPEHYSQEDMENVIESLLETWSKTNN